MFSKPTALLTPLPVGYLRTTCIPSCLSEVRGVLLLFFFLLFISHAYAPATAFGTPVLGGKCPCTNCSRATKQPQVLPPSGTGAPAAREEELQGVVRGLRWRLHVLEHDLQNEKKRNRELEVVVERAQKRQTKLTELLVMDIGGVTTRNL